MTRTHSDDDVLSFAMTWSSLGGGSAEEIRARFGVEPCEFFAQVHHILDTQPPQHVSSRSIARMRRVSRHRRWLGT